MHSVFNPDTSGIGAGYSILVQTRLAATRMNAMNDIPIIETTDAIKKPIFVWSKIAYCSAQGVKAGLPIDYHIIKPGNGTIQPFFRSKSLSNI